MVLKATEEVSTKPVALRPLGDQRDALSDGLARFASDNRLVEQRSVAGIGLGDAEYAIEEFAASRTDQTIDAEDLPALTSS